MVTLQVIGYTRRLSSAENVGEDIFRLLDAGAQRVLIESDKAPGATFARWLAGVEASVTLLVTDHDRLADADDLSHRLALLHDRGIPCVVV